MTNVRAELAKHPDVILLQSGHRSFHSLFMKGVGKRMSYRREKTMLAPHFRRSMADEIDPRLPEGEQGLGLMTADHLAKFYPVERIPLGGEVEDVWLGRKVRLTRNSLDGVPEARWVDGGEKPMQLLSRWYGFAFTYPGCEIYGE